MKTSTQGLDLIKKWEGLRLEAYLCASGVPTIGWGHCKDVQMGDTISIDQASDLLKDDLVTFEHCVGQLITVKINQNEFDALVSFAFNVGCGALEESTLRKKLNSGADRNAVAEEFGRWVKGADGQPLQGLVNRRAEEKELFLKKTKHPKLGQSIYAKQDTWLKKRMADSQLLTPEEKVFVPKGSAWQWSELTMFAGSDHRRVKLTADGASWFIYEPHWKVINDVPEGTHTINKSSELNLDVPYYSQRDNYRDADRTCYSSSCAMLLSLLKPEAIDNDDEYIKTVFDIGDTTEAWVQVKALAQYGIESKYRQDGGWDDIDRLLENNVCCPIGILHRGDISAPTGGGHWIVVRGKTADGKGYYVNDPFGELDLLSGTYLSADGKNKIYSKENLGKRWLLSSPHDGWMIEATDW